MKIAIIGKVNPGLTFKAWVSKLQSNVELSTVTKINITGGNGILNQYVRQYAHLNGISVIEYAPDYKSFGDEAKLIRNLALVNDSDRVVRFITTSSSKEA